MIKQRIKKELGELEIKILKIETKNTFENIISF